MKKLFAVLSFVLLAFAFVSCENEPTVYTVSFVTMEGGSGIPSQMVRDGGYVQYPADPVREGFEFLGWSLDPEHGISYEFSQPVHSNLTLYAMWKQVELRVDFVTDGGSTVASQHIAYGDKVSRPADPVKEGHEFTGWYSDASLQEPFDFSTSVKDSMTLYAGWKADAYTVTFDPYGGVPEGLQTVTVMYGERVPSSEIVTPTREGYDFKGWYYKGVGGLFSFSDPIVSDTELVASWRKLDVNTITFSYENENYGTTEFTQDVYEDEFPQRPDDPERPGHTFRGWFEDDFRTPFNFSRLLYTDVTVHGLWDVNEYTLSFDTCGGNVINPVHVEYFSSLAGKLPTPKRYGYDFAGWHYDSAYEMPVGIHDIVEFTSDTTIYAKWSPVEVVVTFMNAGASGPAAQTYRYGDMVVEPEEPSMSGRIFTGWYADADCTIPFDFADPISTEDDFSIYAGWTNVYSVAFEAEVPEYFVPDVAVELPETMKIREGGHVTDVADPVLVKGGKEVDFLGWFLSGSDEPFDFATTPITSNTRLYARWVGYTIREDGTYEVSNEYGLMTWAEEARSGDVDCVLVDDIVMTGDADNWSAVGRLNTAREREFSATFDGGGHSISNLRGARFTDRLLGTIKDLTLVAPDMGSLTGMVLGDGTISDTHIVDGTITSLGSFVSNVNQGTVERCSFNGTLTTNNPSTTYVGGLVSQNKGLIIACGTSGTINANSVIGGIAGRNIEGGEILGSYSTADITVGTYGYIGGIASSNYEASIVACYFAGTLTPGSSGAAGGIAQSNSGKWSTGDILGCHSTFSKPEAEGRYYGITDDSDNYSIVEDSSSVIDGNFPGWEEAVRMMNGAWDSYQYDTSGSRYDYLYVSEDELPKPVMV